MIDWSTIPWNALIWLIFSGILIFGMNQFADKLMGKDPEGFQRRKKQITIYAYVISSLSILQLMAKVELNPCFSYGITAALFFWIAKTETEEAKKKTARGMAIVIAVLAYLASLGGV